jgi:hypothetical protein
MLELPEQRIARKVKSLQAFRRPVAACQQAREPALAGGLGCPPVHVRSPRAALLGPGCTCDRALTRLDVASGRTFACLLQGACARRAELGRVVRCRGAMCGSCTL